MSIWEWERYRLLSSWSLFHESKPRIYIYIYALNACIITFQNLIPHFLYLSLYWLRFVPYVPHIATSNTTTHFINKNLVYQLGSPPSGVLACIYPEFLESVPFKYILPNTAHYFRYIDDILLIYPQGLNLHSITDKLNNVEPSLKFTYELDYNYTLPFLDILLIRNINKLEFMVYRKPTCKNDPIHFYSHHNNNAKRSIIRGFYLRAIRICSSKYLNDEFIHIENSFLNLQYPKSFIHFAKSKALKIHNKNQSQTNVHSISNKTSSPHLDT